uniref:Transmembrane protein 131-like n=1 Tax=Sinocyclocheilus rhinocerous TaxID=307959 RepID=A0A673J6H8_9TELE
MASKDTTQISPRPTRTKLQCVGLLRLLFIAFIHVAQADKQAFIQSDNILEVLHFGEGGLLQTESDIDLSSYRQKSVSSQRGNSRPIRFEPPMLDFHEQPVGMPKMEKVYLHNPSSEEISLISISATTSHFHASFFQNRIIPPGGNTSFDVVFLARVVGNVENTLFINTSHHGVFTYQVFGVGIPNPYRLRPFVGARVPVNSSFSPLISIFNPHSEPLQVVEMYTSGGDLHLELPTGQQGGTKRLWEIAPFETKGVMRASFSSRDADNHTAFIRIKTNASNEDEFIILPVEVEVTTAPGIYSSTEMLDFGTLRSQDRPKQLNLHLLNSGAKDVSIMSVRPTPSNEAVTVDFKQITLKAGESRYTKVASISFDGKSFRTVREVISRSKNLRRARKCLIWTNASISAAKLNKKQNELVKQFMEIIYITEISLSLQLEIKSWLVTGDSLSMELLNTERGNRNIALSRTQELQKTSAAQYKTVILASGYYAAFKVTLVAKALEGVYDGAVHITTDYEILTIPVKALIAVGTLSCSPKQIILNPSFPGKVVHQGFSIQSSFSQKVRLQQIRSLTEDVRFYFKRLLCSVYFVLQCGDHCYVGLPFVLKSESRPHGLVMQEDIWDADVDLHQRLLKRWRELKEHSGLEVEAFFEVNTDLQKNVQAKILAQLTWPLLVNSSQQIYFPLTNTNSSSEEEVILENPADVPVYIQVLPVALYPNPTVFTGRFADRFPLGRLSNINIDTNTLEFQVHKNHSSGMKSFTGFVEGLTRPYVYNMLLMPGEIKSFNVRFRPITDHSVSSLLVVRNNLTVVDLIVVHGQGTTESLRLAGKAPGLGSSLRFKHTEAFLKDCSEAKAKEPNFTLRRTFRLENTGLLPIHIRSMEISGSACEGYGFKVLNCEEFALKPNTSKDLVILFTPDFTSSRVIRELKLVTAGGSVFAFVLNASLPYHMLAVCAETLPRPNWELELYIIVSLIMSSMFLLVIATAYLEAQGIWEPFKRRMSVESNSPMETGKPFDLREIVRIQSDANLNDFADSNQNSTRGMYGSSGGGRAGGRQGGPHSSSNSSGVLPDSKPRSGSGRSGSMQHSSSFPLTKDSGQGLSQLTNRRARSSKQQQQSSGLLEDLPSSGPSQSNSTRANSTEEQDYSRLVAAMDKDLDRPESPAINVSSQHNSQQSSQNKVLESKGKVKNKTKALKKKEEKERKSKGKTQGEDLKEPLADNDDSSSTTTETSNPDVEANIKEEPVKVKGKSVSVDSGKEREEITPSPTKPKTKKQPTTKKENQVEKSSSLELPYVTPLEKQDKQRKTFTKTLANTGIHSVPKLRALSKISGKMSDDRPSPLGKFVVNGSMQELGHSSGSEGEKESPPPEWDDPFNKTGSPADSLQQISMQTMHADPFLKGPSSVMPRTCSPPPTSPSLVPCGSYGSVPHTSSEANLKKAPGNKLTKSASLPGQNGNPTFAAVAAGYDKSPGGSGSASKADSLGKVPLSHMTSVESDGSDSSGLWNPIDTTSPPSFGPVNAFSAFGPNNPLNLSGVFRGMTVPKSSEPQQSWPDYTPVSPSIWDTEPSNSWATSTGSPATPTTSILGSAHSPWSFSRSIWSTGNDSTLHSFNPPTSSAVPDLGSHTAPPTPAPNDIGRTYNPWSMGWSPSLNRWNSEPWPNSPDNNGI